MTNRTQNKEIKSSRIHFLYRITNEINEKIYIGQTVDINRRWYQHRRDAADPTQIIHHAINKYGAHNFEFEIIATCKGWYNVNDLETLLIDQYDSLVGNEKGYNVSLGGYNAPKSEQWIKAMKEWHASLSVEQRAEISRKQSEAHMGEKNPMYGVKHTEEMRQLMLEVHTGRKRSEETKDKMSEAAKIRMKEKPHTIPVGMTGRKHSEETKKILAERSKGRVPTNKIIFSEEQLQNIIYDCRSANKIAKDYNVSQDVIFRIKRDAGVVYERIELLSVEQVQAIAKDDRTGRELSLLYNVSKSTIDRIKNGTIIGPALSHILTQVKINTI